MAFASLMSPRIRQILPFLDWLSDQPTDLDLRLAPLLLLRPGWIRILLASCPIHTLADDLRRCSETGAALHERTNERMVSSSYYQSSAMLILQTRIRLVSNTCSSSQATQTRQITRRAWPC